MLSDSRLDEISERFDRTGVLLAADVRELVAAVRECRDVIHETHGGNPGLSVVRTIARRGQGTGRSEIFVTASTAKRVLAALGEET